MAESCAVIRIVSSHPKSQGPFVEINAGDFDPAKHQKYEEKVLVIDTKGKVGGFTAHPNQTLEVPKAKHKDPLDHDGDGKKGGAKPVAPAPAAKS